VKYEIKLYLPNGNTVMVAPKVCKEFTFVFSCCGKTVAVREGHEEDDCRSLGAHYCQMDFYPDGKEAA
jgi:hypothetical protein